jgi:hypothetical protein
VAIADPNTLGESFTRGAGVQQNVNSTNQAYYQNNLQDKQASQTLAYNYADLAETTRKNTNDEKQTAINADINTRQKQAEALDKETKARQDTLDKLANKIDENRIALAKANGAEKTAIEGRLDRLIAAYKKAEGEKSNSPLGLLENPTVQAPAPKATPPPQKAKAPPAKRVSSTAIYNMYGQRVQ